MDYGRGWCYLLPRASTHTQSHLQQRIPDPILSFPFSRDILREIFTCSCWSHICSPPGELLGHLSASFAACFLDGVNALQHIEAPGSHGLHAAREQTPVCSALNTSGGKYSRRAEPMPCWEQPQHQLLHLLYSADVKVRRSIMKKKTSNIYPVIASSARAWAYNCKIRN